MTKADIENYYSAEKRESLVFIFIGLASFLMAIIGWFYFATPAWKGASVPLFFIGALPLVVGFTVYSRSEKQKLSVVTVFEKSTAELKSTEIPRMSIVNRNFVLYRWVEIVFIVAALTIIKSFYHDPAKQFWFGFGVALAVLATILLIADHFAEKRAGIYTKQLEQL